MEGCRKLKFGEVSLQICQSCFARKPRKKFFDLNPLLRQLLSKVKHSLCFKYGSGYITPIERIREQRVSAHLLIYWSTTLRSC